MPLKIDPTSIILTALIDRFEQRGSVADDKGGTKTKRKTEWTAEHIIAAKTITRLTQ